MDNEKAVDALVGVADAFQHMADAMTEFGLASQETLRHLVGIAPYLIAGLDLAKTGAVCGPKPPNTKQFTKYVNAPWEDRRASPELQQRRDWRRCKRAFTQVKQQRLPRGWHD